MLSNERINWLCTLLITGLMFFLIIPKGGVMPIGEQAYLLLACFVAFLLAIGFVSGVFDSRLNLDIYWLLPVGAFVLTVVFQNIYSQNWVINVLVIEVSPLSEYLNKPSFRNVGYFLSFFLFAYCIATLSKKQIVFIFGSLAFLVAAQAVFGLWHVLSSQTSVLGIWDKTYFLKDATGTFFNRNHYAGFFAITTPLVLGGFISQPSANGSQTLLKTIIAVSIVFVSGIAGLTSHSRMGFTVFFLGLIIWWLLHSRSMKTQHIKTWFSGNLVNAGFMFLLFLLLIWFGVDELIARFIQLENGVSRFDVWSAIVSLPKEVWLYGVGISNFADVFSMVKPEHFTKKFLYAHNDYIEFIFELGILGGSLLALSFAVLWVKCKPKSKLSGVRVGAVASLIAVAVHSIVDFNLQIPANALFVSLAVGVFMNHNVNSSDKLGDKRGKVRKQKSSSHQGKVKRAKRPKFSMIEN